MLRKNNVVSSTLFVSLLIGMILVAACGTPAATQAPAATEAPAMTEAPAVTEAPATTEDVTITWFRLAEWSAADPSIIETFEASHPGIKVKVEEVPFSEFVNQINLRFGAGDTSLDVISADGPLVASYGYRGWLLPLDGVYSEAELADFLPSSLAAGTYDGKLIAGPVSTSTQLLYYNADAFKAAGVTPPGEDDRWTWEQVAEAAQKVQVVGADSNVSTWGFQWEQTTAPYQLLPLAGSFGGQYIGEDGLTVDGTINSEPWIKGATFYSDMYNKYKVAPQSDAVGAPDLFVNGNLAMVIAGPWQISNFGDNAKFEWGVSRHPYFEGEEIVTTTGGWHIAVNSVSEHPEEAKEFARWLSTGEGAEMWWRIGSHDMPAQKSILEMFATNEEFNDKPLYYNRVAAQEAAVNPVSRPVTVGFLEYDQIYRDTFQDIRIGTDPTEALNTMVDRLTSELAKYR